MTSTLSSAGPRIGSACSGYGGLDLGLITAIGGSVAWHVEYDKHPSAVLKARFPGVPNYGDVTTVDWSAVEPVDWFTAGYPCQPFSHAGKRRGSKDERHLWPAVRDAISVLRPRRVLLENVAGHLSLGLDTVLGDFAALGYDTRWGVVRASDAGAPHGRARIFLAAEPVDRGSAAPADTDGGVGTGDGLSERRKGEPATTRAGEAQPGRRGRAAADTERSRRDGRASDPQWESIERTPAARGGKGAHAAADADRDGLGRLAGLPAERGAVHRDGGGDPDGCGTVVEWGAYAPAVARWEAVTGRRAPRPTEVGTRGAERLSPRFVEWMMGLPAGWVTDILPRNAALKALGNGVVPQQAALALRLLLPSDFVAEGVGRVDQLTA